jgi:tetratricopeptide (TPR) repeat protein
MRDILALQAEVTGAIAREIQVKVTPPRNKLSVHARLWLTRKPTMPTWGLRYWDRRTPDATQKAIQSFEHAIARDPGFAVAHAGLAQCFNVLGLYGYAPPAEGCGKAKALALQALAVDPNLAQAHASLAWAVQYYDYDFLRAERVWRRSIALDPRYAVARYRLALSLTYVGRFEEAIAESKFAVSLDPYAVTPNPSLDFVY